MMSKHMMVLTLAVAALYALPATASAQEAHVKGVTTFTGSAGVSTLQATSEPKIVCGTTSITGSYDSGSTTTGKLSIDFTGCFAEFFGIKSNCSTSGSSSGTVAWNGTFHVVTINNKPGILVTPAVIMVTCAGFSNIKLAGNFIVTITEPACGASSNTITATSGSILEHPEYTGVKFDLTAQTGTGTPVTAGLITGIIVLTSGTAGTVECT
jgi:hypothetical protein